MLVKKNLPLFFLIFSFFLFTACSNEETPITSSSPLPPSMSTPSSEDDSSLASDLSIARTDTSTTIELGVMPSMDYLPIAVALREGYFAEVGITVVLHPFFSANERDAAFTSKSIDGTIIDYTGAILQRAGGVDLRLTSQCSAPFYLLTSATSGVQTISELRNKNIAVSQNTVVDYVVDQALASVNIAAKAIHKVEINRIPIRYEMLINNKIDATALPDPLATIAITKGATLITSNAELGLSITGIMFRADVLQTKQESLKKFYIAYAKGVEYLSSHSTFDIKDILEKQFGFPPALVQEAKLVYYTPPHMPSKKDIDSVARWLAERGLIEKNFSTNSLLDSSYLP